MSYKKTCIKCNPADWQIENLAGACPKCGLRMIKSSRKNVEWVEVRGNLDLAWDTGQIKPPENLEIHGDLDYTGCINIQSGFLKSLVVHGNMFMCNVEKFEKLPANGFSVGGKFFCRGTLYGKDGDEYESDALEERKKSDKLKKKLPEFEGIL
jgi:hypothetical protein